MGNLQIHLMIWSSVIFTMKKIKLSWKKKHLCGIYYFTDYNTSGEYKFDANNFVILATYIIQLKLDLLIHASK